MPRQLAASAHLPLIRKLVHSKREADDQPPRHSGVTVGWGERRKPEHQPLTTSPDILPFDHSAGLTTARSFPSVSCERRELN